MGSKLHSSSNNSNMLRQIQIRWHMYCAGKRYRQVASLLALLAILFVGSQYRNEPTTREPLRVERHCQDPTIEASSGGAPAKPLIILVAGGSRTGTTFLYNLLRIVLRQRDPNTISGWFEDLSYAAGRYASPDPPTSPVLDMALQQTNDVDAMWKGALDSYLHTGTTVLVKVHSLAYSTRLFTGCDGPDAFASPECPVDLVLYSTRELCAQIASIRRMGWGNVLDRQAVLDDPTEFCRKQKDAKTKKDSKLSDEDWAKGDVWVDQALALAACNKEWLKATGMDKLLANVPMEGGVGVDLVERIIRRIKDAGGDDDVDQQSPNSIFKMDAEMALAEAKALRPLACSSHVAVNPITHYHRGHVVAGRSPTKKRGGDNEKEENRLESDEEDKQRGCAAIEASPDLRKLMPGRV
eukprot:CAMPEP_0181072756 /NCGR_PEP_ID=MMETSP1070-20121207/28729_1 /TAXON_ID=265543 /ORGANISM="Minutocellus polymorphus, Strain NH13" /LENGTH=409 /DNA_ID=CAMNT_0023153809 /DNA_START=53 /DNA_END=1282 /DNA_ORIENTATION=-